jgi:tyrosine phenol-lyase
LTGHDEGWPLAEPYKTKMIEWIALLPPEDREAAIRRAGYNPFRLLAQEVYIDLLTDSGTSAMSQEQWSALMRGDEAYAGSVSFQDLEASVRDVLGFPRVLPTHQGRAAEHVLFRALVKSGDLVPNNLHFDTTKAHVLNTGATPVDVVIPEGGNPEGDFPFKGNVDVSRLASLLRDQGDRIPLVMVTVTSNQNGGQPVSLENLRAVRALASEYGKPLFLDAARFAENAYLIQQREPGQSDRSVAEIAREMMSLADGCTMSAKKDPMVNIGGFVALRSEDLYRKARDFGILYEGYATYGGLAGRDLAALAQGLRESVLERHLAYRTAQVAQLHSALQQMGVPVMSPVGGHGVYIDAGRMLPHISRDEFPGWALSIELYRERGIRGVEIGTVMAGRDPKTGDHDYPALDLVRLAIPRRVYSQAHLAQVAEACRRILARRDEVRGYRFTFEPPTLRHFAAEFAPL